MKQNASGNFVDMAAGSNLDYGFDWTRWLESDETIEASEWETDTDSIALTNDNIVVGDKKTVVFAGGGVIGEFAKISNTITTSKGRIDSRTITLAVKSR